MAAIQHQVRGLFGPPQHFAHIAPAWQQCHARSLPNSVRCALAAGIATAIVRALEVVMARITVTDLPQSDVLDRQAMRAIAGGALTGAPPAPARNATPVQTRIFDFPPGFGDRKKAGSASGS